MRVLYVNHGLGERCGVHDFGRRHARALVGGGLEVNYRELDSAAAYAAALDDVRPDAVLFNYMPVVLPWVHDPTVRAHPAVRVAVQHLYDATSVSSIMDGYGDLFQAMFVLDPALSTTDVRVHAMVRPPIPHRPARYRSVGPVRIGSFGFGLPHKRFDLVAREVNRAFDHAQFHLHMTVGNFTGDYTDAIVESVKAELTKPGVTLHLTTDYASETEIVDRLARNDVNALFYELDPTNAGLSSAADYLLAAERPMLLTDCASFLHVARYAHTFPRTGLDEIVDQDRSGALEQARNAHEQSGRDLRDQTVEALRRLVGRS